jgi:hypothetical protein
MKRKGAKAQRRKKKREKIFLDVFLRLCVFAPLRFLFVDRPAI